MQLINSESFQHKRTHHKLSQIHLLCTYIWLYRNKSEDNHHLFRDTWSSSGDHSSTVHEKETSVNIKGIVPKDFTHNHYALCVLIEKIFPCVVETIASRSLWFVIPRMTWLHSVLLQQLGVVVRQFNICVQNKKLDPRGSGKCRSYCSLSSQTFFLIVDTEQFLQIHCPFVWTTKSGTTQISVHFKQMSGCHAIAQCNKQLFPGNSYTYMKGQQLFSNLSKGFPLSDERFA